MASVSRGRRGEWCALALLFAAGTAFGQGASVRWVAPPECPSEAEVRDRVERLARERAVELPPLEASATVRRLARGFGLKLSIAAPVQHAERELEAAHCTELADAAAWLIVAGYESLGRVVEARAGSGQREAPGAGTDASAGRTPRRAEQAEAGRPVPRVRAARQGAVVVEAGSARETARPRASPRLWARVGVVGGVWAAQLPAPQAMLGVSGGVGFSWLYAELRLVHAFGRTQSLRGGATASYYSDQATGLGCALFDMAQGWLRAGPCLHVSVVRTRGSTRGTLDPATRAQVWGLSGASAQLALRVHAPIELVAEGGTGVPITPRPRFRVVGHGDLAEAAILSPYALLSIAARW